MLNLPLKERTAVMNKNDLLTTCIACDAEHFQSERHQERPFGTGSFSAIEVGGECPSCGHWLHSYYMNGRLQTMLDRLVVLQKAFAENKTEQRLRQMEAQKKTYKKAHDRFNRRMRKKHGTKSPAQWLAEVDATILAQLQEPLVASAIIVEHFSQNAIKQRLGSLVEQKLVEVAQPYDEGDGRHYVASAGSREVV